MRSTLNLVGETVCAAVVLLASGAEDGQADTMPVHAATASESQARVPDGLSTSDWSSIRAAYEANRHAAYEVEDGCVARNPGQQWRTRFDGRGFVTSPDAGAWSWGLALVSYGVNGAELCVGSVAPTDSRCGQRLEYVWDATLTEWYINDQRGLEHGYTVHQRPDSSALRAEQSGETLPVAEATGNHRAPSGRRSGLDSGRESGCDSGLELHGTRPLQFTLAVRGNLMPRISSDGRNVTFVNAAGAAVVNYNGLTVFDATGAVVPAWFEEASGQPSAAGDQAGLSSFVIGHSTFLRIVIDDTEAVYPLTIDPIAQQATSRPRTQVRRTTSASRFPSAATRWWLARTWRTAAPQA